MLEPTTMNAKTNEESCGADAFLEKVQASVFPLATEPSASDRYSSNVVRLPLVHRPWMEVCGADIVDIAQLAWTLVLMAYLNNDSASFSYHDLRSDSAPADVAVCCVAPEKGDSIPYTLKAWQKGTTRIFYAANALQEKGLAWNTALVVSTFAEEIGAKTTACFVQQPVVACFTHCTEEAWFRIRFVSETLSWEQAEILARSFEHVFALVCTSPEQTVGSVCVSSSVDHHYLSRWNAAPIEPIELVVDEVFSRVARATPKAQAVCSWDGHFTYEELDQTSTKLALNLATYDIQAETIVPLLFEKSAFAIIAALAITKAGGAFVFLDPKAPRSRQQHILKSVEATVMLVSGALAGSVEDLTNLKNIAITPEYLDAIKIQTGRYTLKPRSPRNAAYVVFTSGSTGVPKGIVVEHEALSTSVRYQGKAMEITAGSRVLQYAAYTFDVSIGDIFTTLTQGACLCIPSESDRNNRLAQAMEEMQVNQACITSSVAGILEPDDVPSLRRLVLGGEPMTQARVSTWADRVALDNIYGPAECTVWCLIHGYLSRETSASNIGHAMGGTRTWIMDPNDSNKLVPIGGIGELLLEGPLLARGYLNDPVRTSEAFISSPKWRSQFPQATVSGNRLYKTGDLVRYDVEDGSIIFCGRKDTQVKLRGQRIELGEIESHIRATMGDVCNEVVVEMIKSPALPEPFIVAFIAARDYCGFDLTSGLIPEKIQEPFQRMRLDIVEKLSQSLPTHMMPRFFLPIERIPITASGKTDRRSLRLLCDSWSLPQWLQAAGESRKQQFQNDEKNQQETILAQLWAEVLGFSAVDIRTTDNFVGLGGDSISAMKLVALGRNIGFNLSVARILANSSLADLARHGADTVSVVPISDSSIPFHLLPNDGRDFVLDELARRYKIAPEDIMLCTPLQNDMVLHSETGDKSQTAQEIVKLSPALRWNEFQTAWEQVMQLLPILRTRFVRINNEIYQIQMKEFVQWQLLERLPGPIRRRQPKPAVLGERLVELALHLDNDNMYFVVRMHHALFDGVTLDHVFNLVHKIYHGINVTAPILKIQDLLHHQAQTSPDTHQVATFWSNYLRNPEPKSYPPLPNNDYKPLAYASSQRLITLPASTPNNLRTAGITPGTLVRSAWAVLLSALTASPSVIFSAFVSGRSAPIPNIEHIVAPTIACVPVAAAVHPRTPCVAFLQRMQGDAVEMIPHEQDGMRAIAQTGAEAERACKAIRNLLVVQPVPGPAPSFGESGEAFPGEIISGPRVDAGAMAEFHGEALLMECTLLEGAVFVRCSFDEIVLTGTEMESLLDKFQVVLSSLCTGIGSSGLLEEVLRL